METFLKGVFEGFSKIFYATISTADHGIFFRRVFEKNSGGNSIVYSLFYSIEFLEEFV